MDWTALSLPKRPYTEKIPVLPHEGNLPEGNLPMWQRLSMDAKIPLPWCPPNTVTFVKPVIGENMIQSYPSKQFEYKDNYNRYPPGHFYDSLNDPYMGDYFHATQHYYRMLHRGFITKDGKVKCTLPEFNQYRVYLHKLYALEVSQLRRLQIFAEKQRLEGKLPPHPVHHCTPQDAHELATHLLERDLKQTPKVGGTKEVISPEELKILTGDEENFAGESESMEWIAYQRKLRNDYKEGYAMIRNWLNHESNYLRNIARMEVAAREKRYAKRLKRFHLLCERGWQLVAAESKIREDDCKEKKANQEKRYKEFQKQWEADNRKLLKRKKMRRVMLSKRLGKARTPYHSPIGEREAASDEVFKSSWDLESSINSLASEFEEQDVILSKNVATQVSIHEMSTDETKEYHGKKKQKTPDDASKYRKKRIHFAKDVYLGHEDQASKKIRTDDFTSSTAIEIPGATWSDRDESPTREVLSKLVLDDSDYFVQSVPMEPAHTTPPEQVEHMECSSFGEMPGLVIPARESSKDLEQRFLQDPIMHSTLLPDKDKTDLVFRSKDETEDVMSEDSDWMSTSELDMYMDEISAVQDILESDIPLEQLQKEIESKAKISSEWPRIRGGERGSDRGLSSHEFLAAHPPEGVESDTLIKRLKRSDFKFVDQTVDDASEIGVKGHSDESKGRSRECLNVGTLENFPQVQSETEVEETSSIQEASAGKDVIADLSASKGVLRKPAVEEAIVDLPIELEAETFFTKWDEHHVSEETIVKTSVDEDDENTNLKREQAPEEQRDSCLSPLAVDVDSIISDIVEAQQSLRSEYEVNLEEKVIHQREGTEVEIRPDDKRSGYEPSPELEHVVSETDEYPSAPQTAEEVIHDTEVIEIELKPDDKHGTGLEPEPEYMVSESDEYRSAPQTAEEVIHDTEVIETELKPDDKYETGLEPEPESIVSESDEYRSAPQTAEEVIHDTEVIETELKPDDKYETCLEPEPVVLESDEYRYAPQTAEEVIHDTEVIEIELKPGDKHRTGLEPEPEYMVSESVEYRSAPQTAEEVIHDTEVIETELKPDDKYETGLEPEPEYIVSESDEYRSAPQTAEEVIHDTEVIETELKPDDKYETGLEPEPEYMVLESDEYRYAPQTAEEVIHDTEVIEIELKPGDEHRTGLEPEPEYMVSESDEYRSAPQTAEEMFHDRKRTEIELKPDDKQETGLKPEPEYMISESDEYRSAPQTAEEVIHDTEVIETELKPDDKYETGLEPEPEYMVLESDEYRSAPQTAEEVIHDTEVIETELKPDDKYETGLEPEPVVLESDEYRYAPQTSEEVIHDTEVIEIELKPDDKHETGLEPEPEYMVSESDEYHSVPQTAEEVIHDREGTEIELKPDDKHEIGLEPEPEYMVSESDEYHSASQIAEDVIHDRESVPQTAEEVIHNREGTEIELKPDDKHEISLEPEPEYVVSESDEYHSASQIAEDVTHDRDGTEIEFKADKKQETDLEPEPEYIVSESDEYYSPLLTVEVITAETPKHEDEDTKLEKEPDKIHEEHSLDILDSRKVQSVSPKDKDEPTASAEYTMTAEEDANLYCGILPRFSDAEVGLSGLFSMLDVSQTMLETDEQLKISDYSYGEQKTDKKLKEVEEEDLDSAAVSLELERAKDEGAANESTMISEDPNMYEKRLNEDEIGLTVSSSELDASRTIPEADEDQTQISEHTDEVLREGEKLKDIQQERSLEAPASLALDRARDDTVVVAEHRMTSEDDPSLCKETLHESNEVEVGVSVLPPKSDVLQTAWETDEDQFPSKAKDSAEVGGFRSSLPTSESQFEVIHVDAITEGYKSEMEQLTSESKDISDQSHRVSFISTLPSHEASSELSDKLATENKLESNSHLGSWETMLEGTILDSDEKPHVRYGPGKSFYATEGLFRRSKSAVKRKFDRVSVDVSTDIESSSSGIAYDEDVSASKISLIKPFAANYNVDYISSVPTQAAPIKTVLEYLTDINLFQTARSFEDAGKDFKEESERESVASKDSGVSGQDTAREEIFDTSDETEKTFETTVLIPEISLKTFTPQEEDHKREEEDFITYQETHFHSSCPSHKDSMKFSRGKVSVHVPEIDLSLISEGPMGKHDTGVIHSETKTTERKMELVSDNLMFIWSTPTFNTETIDFGKNMIERTVLEKVPPVDSVPPEESEKDEAVVDFTGDFPEKMNHREPFEEQTDSPVSAEADLSSERVFESEEKMYKAVSPVTFLLVGRDAEQEIVNELSFTTLAPSYKKGADNTRLVLSKHDIGSHIPQHLLPHTEILDDEGEEVKQKTLESKQARFITGTFGDDEYPTEDIGLPESLEECNLRGRYAKEKTVCVDLCFLYDFPTYVELHKSIRNLIERNNEKVLANYIEKGESNRDSDEKFQLVGNIDREKGRDITARTKEIKHESRDDTDELRGTGAPSLNGKKKPEVRSGESSASLTALDTSQKEAIERLQNLRQILKIPVRGAGSDLDGENEPDYRRRRRKIKTLIKFHTGELGNLFKESAQLVSERFSESEDKARSSHDLASASSTASLLTAEQDLCDAMDRYFNEIGEESSGDEKEFSQFFKAYKEELVHLRSDISMTSMDEDRERTTPSSYSVRQKDHQSPAPKSDAILEVDKDSIGSSVYHEDADYNSARSTSSGTISPGEQSSHTTVTSKHTDEEQREKILENLRDIEQLYEKMKQRGHDMQLTSVRYLSREPGIDDFTEMSYETDVQEELAKHKPSRADLTRKYGLYELELVYSEHRRKTIHLREKMKGLGMTSRDYHEASDTGKSSDEEGEQRMTCLERLARKRSCRNSDLYYLELFDFAGKKCKYKTSVTKIVDDGRYPASDREKEGEKNEERVQFLRQKYQIKNLEQYSRRSKVRRQLKKDCDGEDEADSEEGSFVSDGERCQDCIEIERSPIINLDKFNREEWFLFFRDYSSKESTADQYRLQSYDNELCSSKESTADQYRLQSYDNERFSHLISEAIWQHQKYLRVIMCDLKFQSPDLSKNGSNVIEKKKHEQSLPLEKSGRERLLEVSVREQDIFFLYSKPQYKSIYLDIAESVPHSFYQNFEEVVRRTKMTPEKDAEDLRVTGVAHLPEPSERTLVEDTEALAGRSVLRFESKGQCLPSQFILRLDESTEPSGSPELSFTYSNPKHYKESFGRMKAIMTSESEFLSKLAEDIQADHMAEKDKRRWALVKDTFDLTKKSPKASPVPEELEYTENLKMEIRKHTRTLQPVEIQKESGFREPIRGQNIDFIYSEPKHKGTPLSVANTLSHPCYQNFEMVLLMAQMKPMKDTEDLEKDTGLIEFFHLQRLLDGGESADTVGRRDVEQQLPSLAYDIFDFNARIQVTVLPEFNFIYSTPKYDIESFAKLKAVMISESEFLRKLTQDVMAEAKNKSLGIREGLGIDYGIRSPTEEPSDLGYAVRAQQEDDVRTVITDEEVSTLLTLEDQLMHYKISLHDDEIRSADLYFTYSRPAFSKEDFCKLQSAMIYCSDVFQTALADLRLRTVLEERGMLQAESNQDEKTQFSLKKLELSPKMEVLTPVISVPKKTSGKYIGEEKNVVPAEKVLVLSLVDQPTHDKVSLNALDDYEIISRDLCFTYSSLTYSKQDLDKLHSATICCSEDFRIVFADIRLRIAEEEREVPQTVHTNYWDDKDHFDLKKQEVSSKIETVTPVEKMPAVSTFGDQVVRDKIFLHALNEYEISSRYLYFTYSSPEYSKDDFDKLRTAVIYYSEAFLTTFEDLRLQMSVEETEMTQDKYLTCQTETMHFDTEKVKLSPKIEIWTLGIREGLGIDYGIRSPTEEPSDLGYGVRAQQEDDVRTVIIDEEVSALLTLEDQLMHYKISLHDDEISSADLYFTYSRPAFSKEDFCKLQSAMIYCSDVFQTALADLRLRTVEEERGMLQAESNQDEKTQFSLKKLELSPKMEVLTPVISVPKKTPGKYIGEEKKVVPAEKVLVLSLVDQPTHDKVSLNALDDYEIISRDLCFTYSSPTYSKQDLDKLHSATICCSEDFRIVFADIRLRIAEEEREVPQTMHTNYWDDKDHFDLKKQEVSSKIETVTPVEKMPAVSTFGDQVVRDKIFLHALNEYEISSRYLYFTYSSPEYSKDDFDKLRTAVIYYSEAFLTAFEDLRLQMSVEETEMTQDKYLTCQTEKMHFDTEKVKLSPKAEIWTLVRSVTKIPLSSTKDEEKMLIPAEKVSPLSTPVHSKMFLHNPGECKISSGYLYFTYCSPEYSKADFIKLQSAVVYQSETFQTAFADLLLRTAQEDTEMIQDEYVSHQCETIYLDLKEQKLPEIEILAPFLSVPERLLSGATEYKDEIKGVIPDEKVSALLTLEDRLMENKIYLYSLEDYEITSKDLYFTYSSPLYSKDNFHELQDAMIYRSEGFQKTFTDLPLRVEEICREMPRYEFMTHEDDKIDIDFMIKKILPETEIPKRIPPVPKGVLSSAREYEDAKRTDYGRIMDLRSLDDTVFVYPTPFSLEHRLKHHTDSPKFQKYVTEVEPLMGQAESSGEKLQEEILERKTSFQFDSEGIMAGSELSFIYSVPKYSKVLDTGDFPLRKGKFSEKKEKEALLSTLSPFQLVETVPFESERKFFPAAEEKQYVTAGEKQVVLETAAAVAHQTQQEFFPSETELPKDREALVLSVDKRYDEGLPDKEEHLCKLLFPHWVNIQQLTKVLTKIPPSEEKPEMSFKSFPVSELDAIMANFTFLYSVPLHKDVTTKSISDGLMLGSKVFQNFLKKAIKGSEIKQQYPSQGWEEKSLANLCFEAFPTRQEEYEGTISTEAYNVTQLSEAHSHTLCYIYPTPTLMDFRRERVKEAALKSASLEKYSQEFVEPHEMESQTFKEYQLDGYPREYFETPRLMIRGEELIPSEIISSTQLEFPIGVRILDETDKLPLILDKEEPLRVKEKTTPPDGSDSRKLREREDIFLPKEYLRVEKPEKVEFPLSRRYSEKEDEILFGMEIPRGESVIPLSSGEIGFIYSIPILRTKDMDKIKSIMLSNSDTLENIILQFRTTPLAYQAKTVSSRSLEPSLEGTTYKYKWVQSMKQIGKLFPQIEAEEKSVHGTEKLVHSISSEILPLKRVKEEKFSLPELPSREKIVPLITRQEMLLKKETTSFSGEQRETIFDTAIVEKEMAQQKYLAEETSFSSAEELCFTYSRPLYSTEFDEQVKKIMPFRHDTFQEIISDLQVKTTRKDQAKETSFLSRETWSPTAPRGVAFQETWNPTEPSTPFIETWSPTAPSTPFIEAWSPTAPSTPSKETWSPAAPSTPSIETWSPTASSTSFIETWSPTAPSTPPKETWSPTSPETGSLREAWYPITLGRTIKVEAGLYGERKLEPEVKEIRPDRTTPETGISEHTVRRIKDERVSEFKCEHEGILAMSEVKQDSLDGRPLFSERFVKEQLIFPLRPQYTQAEDSSRERASFFEYEKKGLLTMALLRPDKTGEGTLSTDTLVRERDLLPGGSHDPEDTSKFHYETGLVQVTSARPDRLGEGTLLTDSFVEEKKLLSVDSDSEDVKSEQCQERKDC